MSNRTTKQQPPERKSKQDQHLITPFQTLRDLPTQLDQAQCVLHKHEILICGGRNEQTCYSYDTLKNEYKFICDYPSHVKLHGHCVMRLIDNNNKDRNQITLLSFGSMSYGKNKHTLVMKYVSVWSNILNKSNEPNNYNQWVPFTDNHNHSIIIGRDDDDYAGACALIGGKNNNLLFITYYLDNISVFDLNSFQFIKYDKLPIIDLIWYHCFISTSKNEQGQEMMKTNKQNYQMLLFCKKTGLSIEYDEDNNNFQFHQLHVCDDIEQLNRYAYVCINDTILFFGGLNNGIGSKLLHKYLIREDKLVILENTLPCPLYGCVAILNEEDNHIYTSLEEKITKGHHYQLT
ncbi:hypothetical protein RFI_28526 [Reticulomyxa filosa]|uniref:Kelch motif family protein n=1 Tax=Reticulomyxa filosa TaxID=46433 RepID=X6M5H9_RETFI|nr:hypothetical protein RFI_28526 [Reticulomyxa filosa]|eukprot:ETO08861.1 hypothetical protein RFI_28526 [Reticulomyxa filosa]